MKMELAIYGAQGYALSVCDALQTLYPKRQVSCFLVTCMGANAPITGGLPVKELPAFAAGLSAEKKRNMEVLIAVPEQMQPEIEETLENFGFRHYSRLTFARWDELMKLFHAKMGKFLPLSALPVGCHKPFVRIYMAKSHADRPLRGNAALPEYVLPIQAGADCCKVRTADLLDNAGENISSKNGNYCELTALYWIWKNRLSAGTAGKVMLQEPGGDEAWQYYGLCQYRRGFELREDDLLRLVDNDVDVVLPYPLPYGPDINEHHKRYIKEADWDALLQAVEELQPEYAEAFPGILTQKYLYNYNVILARKSVLREYCEWLFPILGRAEELSIPKGCERNDRYIGYMGETLETLYFMKNADRLNVVHAGCRIAV